jgi:hypothetical protein
MAGPPRHSVARALALQAKDGIDRSSLHRGSMLSLRHLWTSRALETHRSLEKYLPSVLAAAPVRERTGARKAMGI